MLCNILHSNYNRRLHIKNYEYHQKSNSNCFIEYLWTPSHIGIRGNDRVDALTKDAALDPFTNDLKIPHR